MTQISLDRSNQSQSFGYLRLLISASQETHLYIEANDHTQ
ncbi:hypothetical protein SPLC1_S033790 [Arthrospira platensis C1]|uniref:Uncharacterized protein n=2 Tax=Limnospira TaxID=2596745 RepID=A0A9P1KCX6_9CYAN|nr:hypothetical protein AmaxDRAFT_0434 [Limnospira maxima CS-328]EKD11548.1 hypothetical protein SPLC1_S033790 [Arthrospira platensis C1]CDM93821.1 conserved protein of unknown function [Limnospira indica PCC 8005]